ERAAQRRMVKDEGRADNGDATGERALEIEPEPPALRARRLEQRVRARGTQYLPAGSADERGRPSVQHRLRRRDDEHDVGTDECGVDSQRNRARRADLDQVLALDVVHLDMAVETAGEIRRDGGVGQLVDWAEGEAGGGVQ